MPPASMVHRFCIMPQAILSPHEQVTFMPPWHFSNFRVQRGTIIQLGLVGVVGTPTAGVPTPGTPIPGIPIPVRSIITALAIPRPSFSRPALDAVGGTAAGARPSGAPGVGEIISGRT